MNSARLNLPISVVFTAVAALSLSSCGKESKEEKEDDVIFTGTYRPAEYYNFLNECDEGMKNGRKVSYNVKGEVIQEELCSYDPATRIHKVTDKQLTNGALAVRTYTEITYNADGNVLDSKEWSEVEKKSLRREHAFTYGADGKLVQSVAKSELSDTVTTTEYGADEVPSKETTVSTVGGTTSTEVSTCVTYFVDYRPCERSKDGKITETITLEGEEFVRKKLVKDQLTEVERFSFLSPGTFPYKNHAYKFYGASGELNSEWIESCTSEGKTATCKKVTKLPDGTEFSVQTAVRENVGMVRNIVGSLDRTYAAWIEKSGTFSAMDGEAEYTGSYSATFDVATFNRDADIKFEMKKVSRPELKEIYISTPYWNETSSSLEDMFADGLTSGSAAFRSITRHNEKRNETLNEITGLTGLATEQVNPSFVFKTEYVYQ